MSNEDPIDGWDEKRILRARGVCLPYDDTHVRPLGATGTVNGPILHHRARERDQFALNELDGIGRDARTNPFQPSETMAPTLNELVVADSAENPFDVSFSGPFSPSTAITPVSAPFATAPFAIAGLAIHRKYHDRSAFGPFHLL